MNANRASETIEIPPLQIGWRRWQRARPAQLRRRSAVVLLGLAASVFVHTLMLAPIWWSAASHSQHRQPDQQGAEASANEDMLFQPMTVFFIEESTAIHEPEAAREDRSTLMLISKVRLLPVVYRQSAPEIDVPNPDDLDANHSDSEANGDQTGRALLFGRYMGQITARISRAWVRPRTALPSTFVCRVEITQDRAGNVQETVLQHCNGTIRWQASLVEAIERSSPLPAPPDPAVFSNIVNIEMDSDPYREGSGQEGFEREASAALRVEADAAVVSQFGNTIERLRNVRGHNSAAIKLTIIGSSRASGNDAQDGMTPAVGQVTQ